MKTYYICPKCFSTYSPLEIPDEYSFCPECDSEGMIVDVLHNNAMLHIFEKSGFKVEMRSEQGAYKMRLNFGA